MCRSKGESEYSSTKFVGRGGLNAIQSSTAYLGRGRGGIGVKHVLVTTVSSYG